MKKTLAILGFVIAGTNMAAASSTVQSLDESFLGQPYDVVVGKEKMKIDTCRDMLKVKKNNAQIQQVLADVDDNTWVELTDEMTSCELSSELSSIGAKQIEATPLSLDQFVRHVPDNLLPSPGPGTKQAGKSVSIYDKYPDIEITGDSAKTLKGGFTLNLLGQKTFKTKSGREFSVASIALSLDGGTWSSNQDYVISNTDNKLWNVKPFDYNSKLNF